MKRSLIVFATLLVLGLVPTHCLGWDPGAWSGVRRIGGNLQITGQNLGTTLTDGLILINPTAAASGAQQVSPMLRLTGQGFKTNAPAGSQQVDYTLRLVPVQGAANPQARLDFSYQINNVGYTSLLQLLNDAMPVEIKYGATSVTELKIDNTSAGGVAAYFGSSSFSGGGLELSANRRQNDGEFDDVNKTHARIALIVGNLTSHIRFDTSSENNTNATERARIDKDGNILINNIAVGASLAKGIVLGAGTDATTNPADQAFAVVKDFAAGDARWYFGSEASGSSRVVLGNGIRIGTNNANGLVFDSLGTAARGIDLSGSALSGTSDYWIYNNTSNFWDASGRVRVVKLDIGGVDATFTFSGLEFENNAVAQIYNAAANTTLRLGISTSNVGLLIGNYNTVASLTAVTVSGSNLLHANIDIGTATGDLVHIVSGTGVTVGFYRITAVGVDLVTVDRAPGGAGTDIALMIYKDVIGVFATDGTNGQRIMNYSHQNKPLQVGGDALATTSGLTSEDITLGGILNVDVSANSVGIGLAPSARAHLAAGTATLAPLKLTAGTNLTTPEAGAIEYDGTLLYLTDGTAARRIVYATGGTDVAVADGGTGVGSWTNGQLLVGNTTGNTAALATLTGTANQVIVTNGASSITLATPQNIATASTPQFARMGMGIAADATDILKIGGDNARPFTIAKSTVAVSAPGAGVGLLRWEIGTNAGTLKLVAYSGTSITGVVVADNIGGGN